MGSSGKSFFHCGDTDVVVIYPQHMRWRDVQGSLITYLPGMECMQCGEEYSGKWEVWLSVSCKIEPGAQERFPARNSLLITAKDNQSQT